ncbi:DNA polymerase III subunit alpha, partial [Candidatus Kaiserbacteria bacterium]|nr:DNA polymerase III subunit alpha [Candidatus Kaiserbacteria bacterium]
FIKNGLTEQKAQKLWELIEPFAAYGFNKAHAASYGRVAYQTAYMKANYPVEYMSAVLTADSGDVEKISAIIHECDRMDIPVLPPDINESFADFSVVPGKNQIRFGLTTIKNFGNGIAHAIIEERKTNGPFTSLANFLSRIHDKNLNKKSVEALIMTGALDRFEERGRMYQAIDQLLGFNKEHIAGKEASQDSLFGSIINVEDSLVLPETEPAKKEQKLQWEKDLLGVYVSGHPLDAHETEIKKRTLIGDIKTAIEEKQELAILKLKGQTVTAGLVDSVKELLTKKGDRMAFIKLVDQHSAIEMVAFPEVYQNFRNLLQVGKCIAIKGKLNIRNEEPSILIDRVKSLDPEQQIIPEVDQNTKTE